MKKLLAYILGLFACAWLVNQAVKLVLEVWQVLFWGAVFVFVGWFAFQIIKRNKDWR